MPNPKATNQADPFPFAYKKVYNPATGEHSWVRQVSPQIPDVILSTGNAEVLQKFYETHKNTLTPADLKYMKARLHTARKLDLLERQAKEALGRGETPKLPELTQRKGYTGLSKTPATRKSQLQRLAATGGAQLEASMSNMRQQLRQEQQSPAMGI